MFQINERVTGILKKRGHDGKVNLIIYVETAQGMLNLHDVCRRGTQLSDSPDSSLYLDGIVFGSDDFCANIGEKN